MNVGKLFQGPAGYALPIIAGGVVLWLMWDKLKQTGEQAAEGVGGLLTGNNSITDAARTDAYKGKGVVGTLGAAVDNTSGGLFSSIGEVLGGWVYDATHSDYDASTGLQTDAKQVATGAKVTQSFWGSLGNVELRS